MTTEIVGSSKSLLCSCNGPAHRHGKWPARLRKTSSLKCPTAQAAPATHCGRRSIGLLILSLVTWSWPVAAQASETEQSPTSDQVAYFESKVRPILVEHCYQCHSAEAEQIEAGLVLDTRSGWKAGGDSGPAIVPGNVDESLLVQAIRYTEDVISGMPPKSKLSDQQIAILEQWVSMGAPDPRNEQSATIAAKTFDLQSRVTEHWCWRPIESPEPAVVKDRSWSESPIDHFVLAKLEQAGLKPASEADKRTWLRRVYYDLIGLPPTIPQIESFLSDDSDQAYRKVVTDLLSSPHYGEKWARHWMDLVRYCETYGHEFDYPIQHAHEYRDYLIRAFNADLPYDQFVREQIAGDRLAEPRRHPTEGFNESIIGTGFWYFHDATHAPTDVLQNEADIIDNQIDVFGKSFLGLTIACARCHDHKFDAISTADYYGLSAFIQSSCRQHAPLDVGHKIEQINPQIETHRSSADQQLQSGAGESMLDTNRLQQLAALAKQQNLATQTSWDTQDCDLLQDFQSSPWPSGWTTSGAAFQKVDHQMLAADGGVLRPNTISSRVLGAKQHGILRSPTFLLTKQNIHLRVKSTANIKMNVIIDNYQMGPFNGLLFRGTFINGKESDTAGQWGWKTLGGDLRKYLGHKVYLEFIDDGDGFVEIDQILLSDAEAPKEAREAFDPSLLGDQWPQEVAMLKNGQIGPWIGWMIEQGGVSIDELSPAAAMSIDLAKKMSDHVPAPRYVLAMADGTPENGNVYVRGSHKSLGEEVPPRFLEALGGQQVNRLELANLVTSADNPLTARVIVNRLWHHLFGRGIVPSVDDFGPQGQPPSHPELLDHLATDLIQNGWSLKHTLGQIVLSKTYRQQSVANAEIPAEAIATVDPANRLLHKIPIKRLSAEAIRDSILAISGGFNPTQFGPSVPTYLTSFMTGRGRPGTSGPIDGNGRRSVYLAVTRNFLNPFMLTFDMPSPFGPQGQRSQSNVPAQALTLLNDPFVHQQAIKWADQILGLPNLDDRQRSARMMEQSHGIRPSERQVDAMEAFLVQQSQIHGQRDRRVWADLAHSLLNMKAFYYVR